jgi:hypothetical protein
MEVIKIICWSRDIIINPASNFILLYFLINYFQTSKWSDGNILSIAQISSDVVAACLLLE